MKRFFVFVAGIGWLAVSLCGCCPGTFAPDKKETRKPAELNLIKSFERTKSKIRDINKAQKERYQAIKQEIDVMK